jgi:hypothetical protein
LGIPARAAGGHSNRPAVLEISGGKEDGATGFDFVDVDLLALPECLDVVESFVMRPFTSLMQAAKTEPSNASSHFGIFIATDPQEGRLTGIIAQRRPARVKVGSLLPTRVRWRRDNGAAEADQKSHRTALEVPAFRTARSG